MHVVQLFSFSVLLKVQPLMHTWSLAPLCHGTTPPGHSSVPCSHISKYTKQDQGTVSWQEMPVDTHAWLSSPPLFFLCAGPWHNWFVHRKRVVLRYDLLTSFFRLCMWINLPFCLCGFQQCLHVLRLNCCFVFRTKVASVPDRPNEYVKKMHQWRILTKQWRWGLFKLNVTVAFNEACMLFELPKH